MCDYETTNNGCGCGCGSNGNYQSRGDSCGCGCGLRNVFGLSDNTLLIIAIIILFILLFCGDSCNY